jgi:hypothetical protein
MPWTYSWVFRRWFLYPYKAKSVREMVLEAAGRECPPFAGMRQVVINKVKKHKPLLKLPKPKPKLRGTVETAAAEIASEKATAAEIDGDKTTADTAVNMDWTWLLTHVVSTTLATKEDDTTVYNADYEGDEEDNGVYNTDYEGKENDNTDYEGKENDNGVYNTDYEGKEEDNGVYNTDNKGDDDDIVYIDGQAETLYNLGAGFKAWARKQGCEY